MKRHRTVVLFVLVALGVSSIAHAAGESAAQQMLESAPADTFLCVATSGGDAMAPAFKESSLGRIWHDPGVRQFAQEIRTALLDALAKQGKRDIPVRDIRNLARLIARCPAAAGIRADSENAEGVDVSGFVFVKAGDKKADISALISQFETLAGEGIVTRRVARAEMRALKAQDDVPVCWGWEGDVLVLLINDNRGVALRSLRRPGRRAAAPAIPAALADYGDALLVSCDLQKAVALVEKAVAGEHPGHATLVATILSKLGCKDIRTFVARAGFQGRNLIVDQSLAMSGAPSGLIAAAKPIQVDGFDRVEAAAVSAMTWNFDVAAVYDLVTGIIESHNAQNAAAVNAQVAGVEQATGINIRAGLIKNIAGPAILYRMPAYQIPQAPNGGWVLMLDVNDPAMLTDSLQALGRFAASRAKNMLQLGAQTTADNQTVNTWVIAPLAMVQVIPALTVKDKTLIVGTQPTLVERALGQLKAADAKATSIRSRDDFRALEARLPQQLLSLKFDDSQSQIRALRMQLQQVWPMLTMSLSSKGIRLPVMLPDIEAAIKDMPASWEYTWREGNDIRSRYEGCGLQSSNVSVGGGAMAAAILMPALSKAKKTARQTVAMSNLKQIGIACHMYAEDHEDKFPPTLEVLCETAGLSAKVLESPRKPEGFEGPSFIYVTGQTPTRSPATSILAYENPDFAGDKIAVLFLDGHVEIMNRGQLEERLAATRKTLEQSETPSSL